MGELGVNYCCFGEYKCPGCRRTWESSKAWRDDGQKCKHCDIVVEASGLEELFHYTCKSCYTGTKGKKGYWKYKFCEEGRKCKSCGEIVLPFLTHTEFIKARKLWLPGERPDHINYNITHKKELCEKCRRLGYYCGTKSAFNLCTDEHGIGTSKKHSVETIDRNLCDKLKSSSSVKLPTHPQRERSSAILTATNPDSLVTKGISYRSVAKIGVTSSTDSYTSSKRNHESSNKTFYSFNFNSDSVTASSRRPVPTSTIRTGTQEKIPERTDGIHYRSCNDVYSRASSSGAPSRREETPHPLLVLALFVLFICAIFINMLVQTKQGAR